MSKDGFVYSWSRTKATYLSTCAGNLAVLFLFIGICAQIFYEDRVYVFIFGISCSLQIINCLILHLECSKDNPFLLFIAALLNLFWIAFAVILFLVFKLWVSDSEFDADMVFQFSLWFFVIISICLAVNFFFLIKHLESSDAPAPTRKQPTGQMVPPKDKTGPTK